MIAALKRKRRALIGELVAADNHVKSVQEQIRAIETVMRLMGYDGDMPSYPVRRATFPIFARGEISREIAAVQREAPTLRKSRDVAKEIMVRKGGDFDNVQLWGRVTAAVKDCSKRQKVRRLAGTNRP
ncbi:MAG: hypothetical protein WCB71_00125 [Aestuariivirga sp.]